MPVNVAQLVVTVGANTAMAEQGIMGLARMLGSGGVLRLGAIGAALAVAGIGAAAVKMAGDFQAQLTQIVTGAGESQSNLKLIQAGVLQMARDTGTSTKQLTDGLYMIESGGYHGAAALAILKAAAEGAKVGASDLGVTADATDTILKNYPDVVNGASGAVNTLIATVAHGKTHMQDLATALSAVLPTAAAAGVGLNDVMAAMAAQTAAGVPAADAATHLRQMLIALEAPSSAAKKALEGVGLSTDQVAAEMHKSLPGALQMITDAVGKKFPKGSAAYLDALKNISGGMRQMQGMLVLTSQTGMKNFSADVGIIAQQVQTGGDKIAGWNLVQGTFNQQMARLGEVFQTLMIQMGERFLPTATQLAKFLADNLIPTINNVISTGRTLVADGRAIVAFFEGTSAQAEIVKGALVILGGALLGFAASAIPAAIAGIMASVVAFGAQAVAAGAAAVATLAAAAPFILVGVAIAAVAIGIYELVQHWSQVSAFFGNVAAAIGTFFSDIGADVQKGVQVVLGWFQWLYTHNYFFQAMVDGIRRQVTQARDFLNAAWQAITGFIAMAAKMIYTYQIEPFERFVGYIAHFASIGAGIVKQFVVDPIVGQITGLLNLAEQWGSQLLQLFIKGIKLQVGDLGKIGGSVANSLLGGMGFHNLSLPHFATGGAMAETGLALVGENGPEVAYMPGGTQITPVANLPGGGGMSAFHGASLNAGGARQPLSIELDGRKLARAILPYLPDAIRQATGARHM